MYPPQYYAQSNPSLAYKNPPTRGRRATPRPIERPDLMSAAYSLQTHAPSGMVVCRQHPQPTRIPTRNHTITHPISQTYSDPQAVNMSSTSNLPPTYRQVLLRDRPEHAATADHSNPKTRLAGHPLAPFLTVPQPPPAD
jgi:hypothetical protein